MKKRILICSSVGNPHIKRLLKVLCEKETGIQVDFMSLSFVSEEEKNGIEPFVTNCFTFDDDSLATHSPFKRKFFQFRNIIGLRKRVITNYDCIIVCAITLKYLLLFKKLCRNTKTLVLYPWGSEILRADKKTLIFLKYFYSKADKVVCIHNSRFERSIKKLLHVKNDKFVDIPYGSELIDMHLVNKISKIEAKSILGLPGKYIITCAHNGYKTQNHIPIINELSRIKSLLPNNTHLVFPMTYGAEDEYIDKVEEALKITGFDYTLIRDYMPLERLARLQESSDVFIHMQKTDASSSSIKEFILAGATVFNGEWLSYPEIEEHGIPYITVNDISDLSVKIEKFISRQIDINVTPEVLDDICRFSYINFVKNWQRGIKEWTA